MKKARGREPSAVIRAKATRVSLKGGKAGLIGMRPATSQSPQNKASEARRQSAMPGTLKEDARSGSSATEAAPGWSMTATAPSRHMPSFFLARSSGPNSQKSSTLRLAGSPVIWPARLKKVRSFLAASIVPPVGDMLFEADASL